MIANLLSLEIARDILLLILILRQHSNHAWQRKWKYKQQINWKHLVLLRGQDARARVIFQYCLEPFQLVFDSGIGSFRFSIYSSCKFPKLQYVKNCYLVCRSTRFNILADLREIRLFFPGASFREGRELNNIIVDSLPSLPPTLKSKNIHDKSHFRQTKILFILPGALIVCWGFVGCLLLIS